LSDFSAVTKIALIIEYDGTRYHGFQLQAGLPTIQAEVEQALGKLTGEKRRVMAASRTDAGVHAKEQVVSFWTGASFPPATFVKGLNYYLPPDVAVRAAYPVAESFSVRGNAVSREYNYYILNSATRSPLSRSDTHLVGGKLDTELMNKGAQALVGEHDFASFASRVAGTEIKSTVRNVHRARIERKGDLVTFNMVANSFLPHQVRNTVGVLVRVGLGRVSIEEFHSIIEARRLGLAGPTAPACGLCLMQVNYPVPLGGEAQ